MTQEPDSLILKLLRDRRAQIDPVRDEVKSGLNELRDEMKSDMRSPQADVASDLQVAQAKSDEQHKHTREQIVGLRRAVVDYHGSVIGHGIIISELEERKRRVEQHLNLPSLEAH